MVTTHDVTIIIPAYCTREEDLIWLDECITSALGQDCPVIVCDDGSPLSPTNVFDKFKDKDILWIWDDHHGVSKTRNTAINYVKTDLILPLDGDDRLKVDTVKTLLTFWDGEVPVYPDIHKFGKENVPHYALLDFDCAIIGKYVGFSSVNVLHKKEQWMQIGGYNEKIDFYEDGEYNARLFTRYCGVRCSVPLVEYRIHDHQRTIQYQKQSSIYAKRILSDIRRLEIMCSSCGGKRRTQSSYTGVGQMPQNFIQNPDSMPLEQDGLVLCQYVGGEGRGKHYYQGMSSKVMYRVTYGVYVYADPNDARSAEATGNSSMLVKYKKK